MRLVTGYPAAASAAERCNYIAAELGLTGPVDPNRLYAVGHLMPGKLLQLLADLQLQKFHSIRCMVP